MVMTMQKAQSANLLKMLYRLSPLLLLIFLDSFSFFLIIPVLLKLFYVTHHPLSIHNGLLPFHTSLHTRNELTGLTISLAMLSALLSAPFVGRASDYFGRKKTMVFCISCVAIGFLLPMIGIIKRSVLMILIGRVIAGFGSASQPVAQAAVADLCQQHGVQENNENNQNNQKPLFLGSIAFMMTLALILGPIAGGLLSNPQLVSWFNDQTPFEFALLLSIFNLLLILFAFKETMQLPSYSRKKHDLFSIKDVIVGLPHIIKRFRVGIFILLFFCLELGWSQYYQSISLFLRLYNHASVDTISFFSTNMGIVMLIGLLIVYPILLRLLSIKTITQYGFLFVLIGLFLCAVLPGEINQWIFSSVVALFTGITYVSLVTLISNQLPDNEQGLVMGYLSAILYFAWMATASMSGFLISWHTHFPLYVATLFVCVGAIFFLRSNKNIKSHS